MKSIPLMPSNPPASRAAAPPVFNRIGVVGLGPSGRAIGLAIRHAWPSTLVIGVDGHDALECAVRGHAVDVGGDDLTMLGEADLIVLTGSVEQSAEVLTALEEYVPGAAVITATCGEAPGLIEAARALPPRLTFVAGLLATSEGAVDEPARVDAGRLDRSEWHLVPAPGETGDGTAIERLRALVTGLGARVRLTATSAEPGSPSDR